MTLFGRHVVFPKADLEESSSEVAAISTSLSKDDKNEGSPFVLFDEVSERFLPFE